MLLMPWGPTHPYSIIPNLGHISLRILTQNQNCMQSLFYCITKPHRGIFTNFHICHTAQLFCHVQKNCSNHIITFWMRAKQNFHQISFTVHKSLVKWTPVHRVQHCQMVSCSGNFRRRSPNGFLAQCLRVSVAADHYWIWKWDMAEMIGAIWFSSLYRCRCLFIPYMMTTSNGNIFHVTGPLWGEFTGPGEFPSQWPVRQSFDVFFDLCLNKRLSKQLKHQWFKMLSCSLWCHCNLKKSVYWSYFISSIFYQFSELLEYLL